MEEGFGFVGRWEDGATTDSMGLGSTSLVGGLVVVLPVVSAGLEGDGWSLAASKKEEESSSGCQAFTSWPRRDLFVLFCGGKGK